MKDKTCCKKYLEIRFSYKTKQINSGTLVATLRELLLVIMKHFLDTTRCTDTHCKWLLLWPCTWHVSSFQLWTVQSDRWSCPSTSALGHMGGPWEDRSYVIMCLRPRDSPAAAELSGLDQWWTVNARDEVLGRYLERWKPCIVTEDGIVPPTLLSFHIIVMN